MDISADTYPYTKAEADLRAVAEVEAAAYFTNWEVREMATQKELERATLAYALLQTLDDWVHERLGTPAEARSLMTPLEYVVYGNAPINTLLDEC